MVSRISNLNLHPFLFQPDCFDHKNDGKWNKTRFVIGYKNWWKFGLEICETMWWASRYLVDKLEGRKSWFVGQWCWWLVEKLVENSWIRNSESLSDPVNRFYHPQVTVKPDCYRILCHRRIIRYSERIGPKNWKKISRVFHLFLPFFFWLSQDQAD